MAFDSAIEGLLPVWPEVQRQHARFALLQESRLDDAIFVASNAGAGSAK